MPGDTVITRQALSRSERTTRRELRAEVRSLRLQLKEIHRRLDELNNSHDKAVAEKKRTDEAALQVQERTVSRVEFQTFKDEMNRIMATQAGANAATAKAWSVAVGIGAIVVNIIIRYLTK